MIAKFLFRFLCIVITGTFLAFIFGFIVSLPNIAWGFFGSSWMLIFTPWVVSPVLEEKITWLTLLK
jgi:hypothetical protein